MAFIPSNFFGEGQECVRGWFIFFELVRGEWGSISNWQKLKCSSWCCLFINSQSCNPGTTILTELSYDGLEIADGGTAASTWLRMREAEDPAEREAISQNLLEYCHLDTLAMVRILEWLRERVG